MKTYLKLNNEIRVETDAAVIAQLKSEGWLEAMHLYHNGELRIEAGKLLKVLRDKGWKDVPPPAYDEATETITFEDGAWVKRNLTAEEIAAATRKIWPDVAAFWSEFTDSEKLGITDSSINGIKLLREELRMWRGEVWSDDPRVQQGLAGLVAVGILEDTRPEEITAK
jgi:hypothetical protein